MTELRKVSLKDADNVDIDPAQLQEQLNLEFLIKESIINQQIIIKHLEIVTDNVITEQDLK